jgi:serine phosphatase RsbU (regulator of sigma subunit)/putative methionine-R-sulfoxide reductase with GAF domain
VNRERLLIGYSILVGSIGWVWLALSPSTALPLSGMLLFGVIALIVDGLSFRVPPVDAHSLGFVIITAAALALGPLPAAYIAAIEGLVGAALLPFLYRRPLSVYLLIARPVLRSGVRAAAILAGSLMAGSNPSAMLLLGWIALAYAVLSVTSRAGREALQGGRTGLQTWWRSSRVLLLGVELAPIPVALLMATIYRDLGFSQFVLAGLAFIAVAAVVRGATLNLQTQRRSVRELALLNEISRAIIRSELDEQALCNLIYREASKVVDTTSFHLGLFKDQKYTLYVRVQDRMRLPRLVVDLRTNGGLIGWIRQTGRALLVEDFTQEMERLPARPRYQSERPPRSGIYVPLIAGEEVIGSISVQSYERAAFDANDLRLLSLIADQAAVAIMRANAFNEARQRAVQLQAVREVSQQITAILDLEHLLPSIVHLIRERFNYHPVHIFTIDPIEDLIRFRASTSADAYLTQHQPVVVEFGVGLVGCAAQEGRPILVDDVRNDPRYIRDVQTTRSELAVPLRIGNAIIGVLDVQSAEVNDFNDSDLFVIQTLADQIAVAIDSANSYTAQREEAWTLNALLQIAEHTGQATTLADLTAAAVRLPPLLIGCVRCYCLLWERDVRHFTLLSAYGLPQAVRNSLIGSVIELSAAPVLAHMIRESETGGSIRPFILNTATDNPAALPQIINVAGSGSLAVIPMRTRASLIGALILDYDDQHLHLTTRQTNLCTGAANQIAGALESMLLAREAEEAARMEQELQVAREIQTALLPSSLPVIAGWQIAAMWRSARIVGGDFYDFWILPHDGSQADPGPGQLQPSAYELGFVIADVSDKGVPAAMFMAMARSLVRAAALDGSTTDRALQRANRWIDRDSESGMFVTLFYARLNPATGQLRYTSAGHNPPILFRCASQQTEELRTPGIALGVLKEVRLVEAATTLEHGDVLVCYTDGVSEAINDRSEALGTERLHAIIREHHTQSADTICNAILTTVSTHARGQPHFDDVTLLVIKYEDHAPTG